MSTGLIGKKLGMTSIFSPEGRYVPVTVIQVGPCVVTQIKTEAKDGYNALQLSFGVKKASRVNKPLKGHFQKSGPDCYARLKEFKVENPEAYTLGQVIAPDIFNPGETIDISGTSKGRGFAGVIKRHGFNRGPMTHGSKNKREPGSIGCSAWPSKVIKGKRLPGQYGMERKTVKNLEIVDIRAEQNLILVKGAVPGPTNGYVEVKKSKIVKQA